MKILRLMLVAVLFGSVILAGIILFYKYIKPGKVASESRIPGHSISVDSELFSAEAESIYGKEYPKLFPGGKSVKSFRIILTADAQDHFTFYTINGGSAPTLASAIGLSEKAGEIAIEMYINEAILASESELEISHRLNVMLEEVLLVWADSVKSGTFAIPSSQDLDNVRAEATEMVNKQLETNPDDGWLIDYSRAET